MTVNNQPVFEILLRELRAGGYAVMETDVTGTRSGFRVMLPNNWVVSVFYGFGSYSSGARDRGVDIRGFKPTGSDFDKDALYNTPSGGWITLAIDAEVAVWHQPDGAWLYFGEDDDTEVKDCQSPDQIKAIVAQVVDRDDAPPA